MIELIQNYINLFIGIISIYHELFTVDTVLNIFIWYNIIDLFIGLFILKSYFKYKEYIVHHIAAIIIFYYLKININNPMTIIRYKYIILAETTTIFNSIRYLYKYYNTIQNSYFNRYILYNIILYIIIALYIYELYNYTYINIIYTICKYFIIILIYSRINIIYTIFDLINQYKIFDLWFIIYFVIIRTIVLYQLYFICNELFIIYVIFVLLHLFWFTKIFLKVKKMIN